MFLFLILINYGNNNFDEKSSQCIELFNKYKVHYFDINYFLKLEKYKNIDISKMFRDSVHTTDYGSEIYAKLLSIMEESFTWLYRFT